MAIAPGTDEQGRHTAGEQWSRSTGGGRLRRDEAADGELLSIVPGQRDRWRIVVGDQRDTVDTPVGGEVVAVRPGGEVRLRVAGRALRGAFAAGVPAHGQLELATDPFGDLRPGGIDVGRAGSILVVGARIDAEALTRARAMGVRGIVVASLPGKDLRDFRASERRQRASLHPSQPFGVLVLDGTVRRSIPTPDRRAARADRRPRGVAARRPARAGVRGDRRRAAGHRRRLGPRALGPQRRPRGTARRAGRPAAIRSRHPAGVGAGGASTAVRQWRSRSATSSASPDPPGVGRFGYPRDDAL